MVFYILEETAPNQYKGFVGYGDYWDAAKDTEDMVRSLGGVRYIVGDMREVEFTYHSAANVVEWLTYYRIALHTNEYRRLQSLGVTFSEDIGTEVPYIQYPRSKDGLPIARFLHHLVGPVHVVLPDKN